MMQLLRDFKVNVKEVDSDTGEFNNILLQMDIIWKPNQDLEYNGYDQVKELNEVQTDYENCKNRIFALEQDERREQLKSRQKEKEAAWDPRRGSNSLTPKHRELGENEINLDFQERNNKRKNDKLSFTWGENYIEWLRHSEINYSLEFHDFN